MFSFKPSFVVVALFVSALARPIPQAAKPFTLQNGKDAIALNNKFTSLTASSPCTAGEQACVNGEFAQCVGSSFVLTPCAADTVCAALPLVNKAGTSITCTTTDDRDRRIAATGAVPSGGQSNPQNAASPSPVVAVNASPSPAASPAGGDVGAPGAKPFTLNNGKQAQALNAKFATLTPNSPCTPGEDACVNGSFAQCVAGKFVLTPCAATLKCFALPLVNKAGTSVTCVDPPQALQRIDATGAGNSLTGIQGSGN